MVCCCQILRFSNKIKVSTYADDIMVILRDQRDVLALEKCFQIYEQASSARVNWEKSEALLCGSWQDNPPPKLPGSLVWRREGLKVLGVFLGTPQYMEKNWEGVMEKACARMSR